MNVFIKYLILLLILKQNHNIFIERHTKKLRLTISAFLPLGFLIVSEFFKIFSSSDNLFSNNSICSIIFCLHCLIDSLYSDTDRRTASERIARNLLEDAISTVRDKKSALFEPCQKITFIAFVSMMPPCATVISRRACLISASHLV